MINPSQFLASFPQFSGVDNPSLLSAIQQAESEYDTNLPGYNWIVLNLIAHILYLRSLAITKTVEMMGVANGTNSVAVKMDYSADQWKGQSLQSTPYGQEVLRLLTPVSIGLLFI